MSIRTYKLEIAYEDIENIKKEINKIVNRLNTIMIDLDDSKENITTYIAQHTTCE